MSERLDSERKPTAKELFRETKALYDLFPAFDYVVEFPDERVTERRRKEFDRRRNSRLQSMVLGGINRLVAEYAYITSHFREIIEADLSSDWTNGVTKPDIKLESVADLSLEELKARGFEDMTEEEREIWIQQEAARRSSLGTADQYSPSYYALGLDDPEEEGIFNPSKAKELDRKGFHESKESDKKLEANLDELGFQQFHAWLAQTFHRETEKETWREEFMRIHDEEP